MSPLSGGYRSRPPPKAGLAADTGGTRRYTGADGVPLLHSHRVSIDRSSFVAARRMEQMIRGDRTSRENMNRQQRRKHLLVLVAFSSLPDLHRLHVRQFAWRTPVSPRP